jgi:hypothetical protein
MVKSYKGFKVFNSNWTCRGFQFEVGKEYEIEGDLRICQNGFHFCTKAIDCFNYYDFDSNNKVAEIKALGDVVKDNEDAKCATNKILIVRELNWHEVLELVNTGKDNTGLGNSGNRNSGDRNSGNWNSGDSNSGNRNSGDRNSGDRNSGDRNSGNWNSGDRNSGDRNSGDFNSCNYSAGVFCTDTPKLLMFDKPTEITLDEWRSSEPAFILRKFTLTKWIPEENMTEEEKEEHDEYETTEGYLKVFSYKEAWRNLWDDLNDEEKDIIQRLPNFDADKFEYVTGVKVK